MFLVALRFASLKERDSLSLAVKTVENAPGLSGRCIETISILNGNLRIVSVDGSVRQVAVLNVQ